MSPSLVSLSKYKCVPEVAFRKSQPASCRRLMKGESGTAKVGCGIQMKEVTSHEFEVIAGGDVTLGQ